MSSNVFANGREIACKASDGKSICAFPDVCFTPPTAPPTPPGVPLPYPNTGMASDATGGSTTVKIHGKEVMLKNKSYFKKSTGNEAGAAPKKGIISSVNRGKVYFASWSMDVRIEGENVVRHMDLTTHNHASVPGNTPPWPFIARMNVDKDPAARGKCKDDIKKKRAACEGAKTKAERCESAACRTAMKCELQPYKKGKEKGCCKGQTPHHIVEVHCFTEVGGRAGGARLKGFERYDDQFAPCVCCDQSSRYEGDHGSMHAIQGMAERRCMDPNGPRTKVGGQDNKWTYKAAKQAGLVAQAETFKAADCNPDCIAAQLDAYHSQSGILDEKPVRADRSPLKAEQKALGEKVLGQRETVADMG